MKNKLKFIDNLNQLCEKIYSKNKNIIVFQTEVIDTSLFYKLNGKYVAEKILLTFEKFFFDKLKPKFL